MEPESFEKKDAIDEIYNILLGKNYQSILFRDLKNFRKENKVYRASCPFHSDESDSFLIFDRMPRWYCSKEERGGDWIDYLMEKNQMDYWDALSNFARESGININEYDREHSENQKEQADFMETACSFFRARLFMEEGNEVLKYLKEERCFNDSEINEMELGYFPGFTKTDEYMLLKGYTRETINRVFKWIKVGGKLQREDYRLVIPFRDHLGRILCIWGRLIKPSNEKELIPYKPLTETEGSHRMLFNLYRAKGYEDIIIMKGFFNTLHTFIKGINPVVGIIEGNLREEHIESIKKYGIKNIILCFGNNEESISQTDEAIELIDRYDLKSFVIDFNSCNLENYLGADELIRNKGLAAFKSIMDKAESGHKWKARRFVEYHSIKYDMQNDRARESLIEKALEYDSSLPEHKLMEGKDLLKIVSEVTGYDLDTLMSKRLKRQERKSREEEEKSYKEFFRTGLRLAEAGKLQEARAHIEDMLPKIKAKSGVINTEPFYPYKKFQEDLALSDSGLLTGFSTFDSIFTIPQEGMTMIAGRASHGKSVFLMNLLISMIEQYPKKSFFFISYEETRKRIAAKLISLICEEKISAKSRVDYILDYIRKRADVENTPEESLEKAIRKYNSLINMGLVGIIDEAFYIEDLTNYLSYLKTKYDIGAVFIDHFQRIKTKSPDINRIFELQRISENLAFTSKTLSIPLIIGMHIESERRFSRSVSIEDFRNSGGVEQDPHLIIGLYNEAVEKAQIEGVSFSRNNYDIILTILKNRDGNINETIIFDFEVPALKMRDRERIQK